VRRKTSGVTWRQQQLSGAGGTWAILIERGSVGRDRRALGLLSPICVRVHSSFKDTTVCASVMPRSRNWLSPEEGGQASPPDLGGPGRRGKSRGMLVRAAFDKSPTMKKPRTGGNGASEVLGGTFVVGGKPPPVWLTTFCLEDNPRKMNFLSYFKSELPEDEVRLVLPTSR
jgi:hypothetical protein